MTATTAARVLIAPGRFDASPAWVRRVLDRHADDFDVALGGELADDTRAAAFTLPGFTQSRGTGHRGRRENAVLTRDSVFEVLDVEIAELTPGGGRGRFERPLCATTVVSRERSTGAVQVWSYCHLPAHVETQLRMASRRGTFRTSPLLWLRAVRAWDAHLADVKTRWSPAMCAAVAD